MSVLERPTSPLKPEVKPKPEIPQRSLHSNSLCLVGGGCTSGTTQGKVKKIAKKFTQQDSSEAGEQLVNGAAALSSSKEGKKPPEIKPKPDNSGPQPQVGTEQAPPLPKKRSRFQNKKDSIGGEDSDGMNVDKRRSAPDGKEVEAQGPGAAEAKEDHTLYSPLSRCCNITCTCMCHLKRPGMMLIWVPMDEHENEGPGGEGKANVKVQREGMDVKGQKVEHGLKAKAAKKQMEVKPAEKEKEMHGEETEVRGQKAKSELDIQAAKEGEVKDAEKEMENENLEKKREVEVQKAENKLEVNTTETEIELNAAQKEGEDHRAENGKVCEEIKEVDDREGKNEAGDERDRAPVVDEKAVKSQFHQSLEILLAGGLRRCSNQGSQLPLAPYRPPPVQDQSLEDKEDSIYELQLPVADQAAKKMSSARKDVPQITISKPAHQSKPANASDSTPELENTTEPPAIPPRVPVNDVPLPWNENNSGRTSPGSNSSFGRIRPPPPKASPPCSPLSPHRLPPAPPKTDSRRASNTFMQSTILSGEENKSNKDKKETEQPFNRKFQLNDEPLYQTYSDFAIRKELRRQTVIRSISKTSADYAMEWAARMNEKISGKSEGTGAAKSGPMPNVNQSTLWQDLPAVRDSGLLDQFTPDQIKYQESMFEVLTSEASYLRSLRVLTEHFMENRELGGTLIISDKKTLFSNITKVREVSERFLKDLEDHIFKEIMFLDICDILNYHAQHNFSAYIDYIRNQSYQEKTYSRLMKTNEQFATVINRLQELPECHRLPFISFLLLPFQRITRIKMLIENILKRTNEGTAEEQTASKALSSVTKIIDQCNRDVGKMRQMEELIEISKMLEFDKLKAIPIISESRFLEKKGELQEMSKAKTFVNMRARFSVVYLFLFNDRLLITVKKGSDRYVVVDHTHRSLVQAQPLDECFGGAAYENCFNLVMLENHQGRMMERILKAPSKSDMQRWLAAFPSSTQEDIDEEVIYEDWDCPQVQCVEQYVAQQADELSLEPTEIVNVIRKTNEGWYEGSRLSDGQKGWFPDVNVIEITNEHVRRRNIKERYRVSQATRMVKSPKTR